MYLSPLINLRSSTWHLIAWDFRANQLFYFQANQLPANLWCYIFVLMFMRVESTCVQSIPETKIDCWA